MIPVIGDSIAVYLRFRSAWVTAALADSTAASASWMAVRWLRMVSWSPASAASTPAAAAVSRETAVSRSCCGIACSFTSGR